MMKDGSQGRQHTHVTVRDKGRFTVIKDRGMNDKCSQGLQHAHITVRQRTVHCEKGRYTTMKGRFTLIKDRTEDCMTEDSSL